MASRVVSTKMAIEGESEYRQAIKNINSELTNLNSKLGVVKSEYQNNQNSIEALSAKSEALADKQKVLADKVETCKDQLEKARSAVDTYKDKISDTESKLKANADAQSKLSDDVKEAGTQFNAERDKVADAESQLAKLQGTTGDTSEEERKLNDTIDESKEAMQKLNDSTGGMAEKAADLQVEEANLNNDLEKNEANLSAAETACQGYETDMNRAQTQLNNTNAEIELNDKYLEEASESADGCATSIDQFGNKTDNAGTKLDKMNNSLDIMSMQMVQRELQKAFEALSDAMMACVDAAAEFEQQMSTVQAISGATEAEMTQLTNIAKEMGSTTTYTATESGEALEYMALAGWKTEDMLDGLPAVLDLAAASGSDLATTSDIVTDALTAFGYEASDASHFSDVLAASSSNSNTTVEQLGSAFQKVGPLAGTMGYSVEDVSEALGLMADSGIKAESAGTALNTMLTRMSGTNSSARDELEKLNVEMYNADGTARPLSDVIDDLRGAFSDLSESEQTEAAYNLAGQRGMSAMLSIVQASDDDYDKLADSIDDCNGAAKDMAETKLDNYAGQVTLLESAWDGLKVEIGEQLTPVLGDVVEWLTNIVNSITGFIEDNPEVVAAITGIATALGIMTAAVAALVAGLKIYQMVQKAVDAMNPFGWVMIIVSAVAALTAGIAALVSTLNKNYNPGVEESKKRVEDLNEAMEDLEETVEETNEAIEENAENTDFLKGAIVDLLGKEQLSEAEKQKMADYVSELNELYPDLGLSIDETTGSLNMEADAFEDLIDAAQDSSEIVALTQEQEEAERAVKKAEDDLTESRRQQDLVTAALNGDEDALNELYDEGLIKTGLFQTETGALTKLQGQLSKEIDNGNDVLEDAKGYYDDCTDACDDLERELSGLSDAEYSSYQKVGTKTEQLCDNLLDLQHSYEDAQVAAKESAKEQFSMFEQVEEEAKKSADEIMDALKSQEKYWKDFSKNLNDLYGRNIDGLDDMVNAINDGSTEAAAYIASMADASDDELRAMVQEYQNIENEQDNYASVTADMSTEYQEQMQEMVDAFTDWVNSNEELTQEDKDYMVQMMGEYVQDISEADEEYEGELEHIYDSTQEYLVDSMNGVDDSTKNAKEALDQLKDSTEAYSEIIEPYAENMESLQTELEELRDKYDEVKEAAKESFDEQFEIFEQVGELAQHSQEEIIEALDSQIQYWADYSDNFDDLCNRNIDGVDKLAEAFSDGSMESAGYLAYFRQASDEEIQQIIDKLGLLDEQTEITSSHIAEDLTNLTGRTDEITQEMIGMLEDMFNELDFSDEGYNWAMNSISEYVNGLEDGVDPSMEVIRSIVGVGGVIEALNFPDEAKQMAYDSIMAYANMLPEGETPSSEAIAVILEGIGKQFADEIEDAEAAGQNTTLGFGRGLSKGSEDAIETSKTEIQSIMDAIDDTAGVHSPSWKTENTGENVMTGFANGFENKSSEVEKTAEKVTKGAIDTFEENANSKTLLQSGSDTLTGFINGVNSETNDVTNALSGAANSGITTWNNSATHTVLFTSGVNTLKGYKDGLDSSKETVYTKLENIASQSIKSFNNAMSDSSLRNTGKNVINGFINGLNDNSSNLYKSMQNLAKNALNSFNNTLGVHSPSQMMYESAANTILGFINGIASGKSSLEQCMYDLAQSSLDAYNAGLYGEKESATMNALSNSIISAIEGGFKSGSSEMKALQSEAENAIDQIIFSMQKELKDGTSGITNKEILAMKAFEADLMDAFEHGFSDSYILKLQKDANQVSNIFESMGWSAEQTISGYTNGISSQTSALSSSMSSAAQTAIDSFNNTLGIHSPSAKAEESAEMTIKGWLNGIDKNTRAVENSMKDLADDAMDAFDVSLNNDMADLASLDNLSATYNLGNAELNNDTTIYITMPIYAGKNYTKTEIVEIALDGINHKQINQYASRGVTL